ncbi:TRAP transporter substrate-binding protein [Marinobacterium aestuarii]|uniref:TRAP transporter substrate-binding protein n=1 Tax=Marinobacterium aestuarii TaxID=1821621 RepID=UPI0012FFB73F|nr:TRAP transporter substrate-binding protein [Marinobacterium aestuarii]
MKINRCFKASVLAMCVMAMPLTAQAKELVAANVGPADTAQGQAMKKFGERLEELTQGELTVQVFYDGQLGGLNETFEQLKGGQIDIGVGVPGVLAEYAPQIQALVVPFVFRDFEHWKRTVNGPVADKINAIVKDKADIQVLGYFGGSVRNLVTRTEVSSLDDLKGLRIRLHPSEILTTAWSSVGIQPTVMAYGEIYNGLQLGVVDGLENEPEWILRMKFYEQAKTYVLTEHEIVTRPFLFSGKTFASLSSAHQAAVLQAGKEAAEFEYELEHRLDAASRLELANEHGMKLVEVDKGNFQSFVQKALVPVIKNQGLEELVGDILSQ